MSSPRPRGSNDSFEWPPSATDLSTVSVLPMRGASPTPPVRPTLVVMPRPPAASSPRRSSAVARLGALHQLALLAAGMLVGAWLAGWSGGERATGSVTGTPESAPLATASLLPRPSGAAQPTAATLAPSASTRSGAAVLRTPPSPSPRPAAPTASRTSRRRGVEAAPAAVVDTRHEAVLEALQRYEAAYSRMDATAAARVWPTADQEALTRTFTAVREQRLSLHDCAITGTDEQASGSCRGTLRYRPRVGDHSTRLRQGTWRFALEREAGRWLIRRVTVS